MLGGPASVSIHIYCYMKYYDMLATARRDVYILLWVKCLSGAAGALRCGGATLALTRAAALGAALALAGAGGATELTAPEGGVLLHLLCFNEGGNAICV